MCGAMGKIMMKAILTNDTDFELSKRGSIAAADVRTVEIEALVDTGATLLAIPATVAEQLGLTVRGYNNVRYADGRTEKVPRVALRFEILGRDMLCDALVLAAGATALI